MSEEILKKFREAGSANSEFFKSELSGVRSSRPHPALLENVRVDLYGSSLPLKQVANIQVSLPNCLIVQPWDKSSLIACEKGINAANLGITVASEGTHLRVILPPLSDERRKEMISIVKRKAEDVRVSLRRSRDEAQKAVQNIFDEKSIGEDEKFRLKEEIQKITDQFNSEIEAMAKAKEAELLE